MIIGREIETVVASAHDVWALMDAITGGTATHSEVAALLANGSDLANKINAIQAQVAASTPTGKRALEIILNEWLPDQYVVKANTAGELNTKINAVDTSLAVLLAALETWVSNGGLDRKSTVVQSGTLKVVAYIEKTPAELAALAVGNQAFANAKADLFELKRR